MCQRRTDLELRGLEAVLIEIQVKSRKVLIGGFYRPPNSNTAYCDLISESTDRAYDTNITDIYILGDFNFNFSGWRWEDNIKEWTGMDFASSTRAAENRSRWKGIVANSSVVPRRPSKVMG